jgi:hypothetical protein
MVGCVLFAAPARAADDADAKKPGDIVKSPAAKPAGALSDPDELRDALLLPTRVAGARAPEWLAEARSDLDDLLRDALGDLGLTVAGQPTKRERRAGEGELAGLAQESLRLVVLPNLRVLEGGDVEIRLMAARPSSRVVGTRIERVARDDLSVRTVVMLRDLMREARKPASSDAKQPSAAPVAEPERGAGRAILAVNGTLYGGYIGFSLQRASGSDDPRLLYPLLGVGAGIGLGAAIIVADEWNVGVGDAWYLAAGAWWPAVAGHLLYEGRFGDTPSISEDEPWTFSLIASTSGLTLSTVGLLSRGMGDGGAVLAHSGGALGLIVGGLTEFAVTGVSDAVPFAGMGYGAIGGWLLASSAAVLFHPDPVRTLTIDLGIALGGLGGASAASPLLFDEPTPDKTRGWVAATGGGLVVGGILAWWLTSPDDPEPADKHAGLPRLRLPAPSMVGLPAGPGEVAAPGPGLELRGLW